MSCCPPAQWRPEEAWQSSPYGGAAYGLGDYGFGTEVKDYQSSPYGVAGYGAAAYGFGGAIVQPPTLWVPETCNASAD